MFRITKGGGFQLKNYDPGDTCGLKLDKHEASTASSAEGVGSREVSGATVTMVFRSRSDPSKKWRGRPSFLFPLLVFFLEGDRLARNVAYASDLLLCLGDQFPCGGIPSGVSLHL